jgi:tetratricopeptide (TPR) repeat protein
MYNRKHIFSDLRPYVCTFELCNSKLFESQNEWFRHELHNHWKQWLCSICDDKELRSRKELEFHMDSTHSNRQKGKLHVRTMDDCLYPRINALECPLCNNFGKRLQRVNKSDKCDVSLKQFQQHVGNHMEQLALSALPLSNDPDENEGESDVFEKTSGRSSAKLDSLSDSEDTEEKDVVRANHLLEEAVKYRALGYLDRAESGSQEAFDIFLRVLGQDHPYTLSSMDSLALTYQRQGRWNEAERLRSQLMAITKRIFGEEHQSAITSMANLVSTYHGQGRLREARDLARQVVLLSKKVLGQNHPDTIARIADLASMIEDADATQQKTSKSKKKAHSLEVTSTLRNTKNEAEGHATQEKHDKTRAKSKKTSRYVTIWNCCHCGYGGMSEKDSACVECDWYRCASCTQGSVKVRDR